MPRRATPPLAPVPLPFSGSLLELVQRGERRRFPKGALLIQEGDDGDALFALIDGRMRAYSVNPANGREITFGTYGPGEYLGEMSLDGGPRSASVVTLEPCLCSVITRATLEQFIRERPDFAFELLAKVIRRARAATHTARQLALNDVYGRLKALLESMAAPAADGRRVVAERLTHQEIAHRIGCTREMVSKVMKDLVDGLHVRPRPEGGWVIDTLPSRW